MTLLEVVLAVLLLSGVFAAVFGTIGTLDTLQLRHQRTLAAYEVAHRLVLQYLDDDHKMPEKSLPIDYGRFKFMYALMEEKCAMELNRSQRGSESAPQGLDRYKQVTIAVYSADPAGDYFQPGEQHATLSRIYDPFAPRNPDSALEYFKDINNIVIKLKLNVALYVFWHVFHIFFVCHRQDDFVDFGAMRGEDFFFHAANWQDVTA